MKKKLDDSSVDDIHVFWTKESFWDDLPYSKKLEYYWKFQYKDGVRVFDHLGEEDASTK